MASVAEARAHFIDAFLKSVDDIRHRTKYCIQTDECIHFYPQLLSKEFIKTAGNDKLRLELILSVISDSSDCWNSKLKVIEEHLDLDQPVFSADESIRKLRLETRHFQHYMMNLQTDSLLHMMNLHIKDFHPRPTSALGFDDYAGLLFYDYISHDRMLDRDAPTCRDTLQYLRSLNATQLKQRAMRLGLPHTRSDMYKMSRLLREHNFEKCARAAMIAAMKVMQDNTRKWMVV